jgi:integrase
MDSASLILPDNRPATIKFPSLFRGSAAQDTHSCAAPKLRLKHRSAPGQQSLWSPRLDPSVLAYAEATREDNAATIVPVEQRDWIRANLSVRDAYEDWVLPELRARVGRGSLAAGTLQKDRQALARWEQFSRPDDWPAGKAWPGLPIGYITPKVLTAFLAKLFARSNAATARSAWSHLRNILNLLTRVRALDVCPRPSEVPDPADEDGTEVYSPEQIAAAYAALKPEVELQVALVVALNAGPRTRDVFTLRKDQLDLDCPRPRLRYVAHKTGKPQCVPLAPVTVAQLKRLPSWSSGSKYLFPASASPDTKDPERSPRARARREKLNELLAQAGVVFPSGKPFQAARATCNTRLETYRTGVGQFVLGHALTLNSRHYFEPSDMIFEAVTSIDQPACFFDF